MSLLLLLSRSDAAAPAQPIHRTSLSGRLVTGATLGDRVVTTARTGGRVVTTTRVDGDTP